MHWTGNWASSPAPPPASVQPSAGLPFCQTREQNEISRSQAAQGYNALSQMIIGGSHGRNIETSRSLNFNPFPAHRQPDVAYPPTTEDRHIHQPYSGLAGQALHNGLTNVTADGKSSNPLVAHLLDRPRPTTKVVSRSSDREPSSIQHDDPAPLPSSHRRSDPDPEISWVDYFRQLESQHTRYICSSMTAYDEQSGPDTRHVPYGGIPHLTRQPGHEWVNYHRSTRTPGAGLSLKIFGLEIDSKVLELYIWQLFEVKRFVDFSSAKSCAESDAGLHLMRGENGQELKTKPGRTGMDYVSAGRTICCHHRDIRTQAASVHTGVITVSFAPWTPSGGKGKERRSNVVHVLRGTPPQNRSNGGNTTETPIIWSAPFGITKEIVIAKAAKLAGETSESDESQSRKRRRPAPTLPGVRRGDAEPSQGHNVVSSEIDGTSTSSDESSETTQPPHVDQREITSTSTSDHTSQPAGEIQPPSNTAPAVGGDGNDDAYLPRPIPTPHVALVPDFACPVFIEQIVTQLAMLHLQPASRPQMLSVATHGARGAHMEVGKGAIGSITDYDLAARKELWHKSPLVESLFKTLLARVKLHQEALIATSPHGRFVPYIGDIHPGSVVFDRTPEGTPRFVRFDTEQKDPRSRRDAHHILARLAYLSHILPNAALSPGVRSTEPGHHHSEEPAEVRGQICIEDHTLWRYYRSLHDDSICEPVPTAEEKLRFWRFVDIEYCDYVAYFASQKQDSRQTATRNLSQSVALIRVLISNQTYFARELGTPFDPSLRMDEYAALNADPTDWLADSFTRLWTE